ncbi:hypothetical protein SAMN02745229_00207 [Butyrivibrio fibrisolvens DSM 3071]|uniref:Acyl carrier protein n=1 Tax=Butyrivibrio fibrisolvens DSM 3071 TaxID=1121131 RepID=A0A1M5Q5L9_BUTFI|nr:hypothetical protein [Butyrivibrio fibrisolvens]SHH09434.1 hypothetical protein SAMN02745229_00207 [Butyrivibrio fibrisolvens DSM 3071]
MMEQQVREWIINSILKYNCIKIEEGISLLDPRNGLLPRDLLRLFFEIQEEFDVDFDEKDIITRRFDYIDNMVNSVLDKKV